MTKDQEAELQKLVTDYLDAVGDLASIQRQELECRNRQATCHNKLSDTMHRVLGKNKAFIFGGYVLTVREGNSNTYVTIDELAQVDA